MSFDCIIFIIKPVTERNIFLDLRGSRVSVILPDTQYILSPESQTCPAVLTSIHFIQSAL